MIKDIIDFNKIKRVLVIKLRHHGDVLLSGPVFTVLKNHYPHLEVSGLVYQDTAPMLEFHPAIANLFTIDRQWKKQSLKQQFSYEYKLYCTLRQYNFDLIIHLTEHYRGMLLTRLLKPRYSLASAYSHRRGRFWLRSYSHIYPLTKTSRHTIERHLDALRRIGIYAEKNERKLCFVPGSAAVSHITKFLQQQQLQMGNFIAIHPTSRWLFKAWPAEQMAQLIDRLADSGEKIVLTAGPDKKEMAFIGEIITKCRSNIVNLSGQLSLKQLGALLAQSKLFIGVDSVPMHLAAAVNTPTIALFGPSNELEWGPWQVPHRVIKASVSCRPCGLDGCGGGKVSECLSDISVEQVFQQCQALLRTIAQQ